MTDHLLITPPDYLLDQWISEYLHIEAKSCGLDRAIGREAKCDFFTKVARWGAREISETPKQRLQRLINKTGNEELIEAFDRLEGS